MARQHLISRTFIALADTLVEDYDPIDFLQQLADRCVDILDATDAGIVLLGPAGLQVIASSSERMRFLELLEVQRSDGPCQDCVETGTPVRADRLDEAAERWPRFTPAAIDAGYRSVYAVPMRLRTTIIGALNLFVDRPGGLDSDARDLGRALADMATIGILHERQHRRSDEVTEQLQNALNSRIIIEQAKGVIAEQAQVDMEEAFARLRRHARQTHRRLTEVAGEIVDRRLHASDLALGAGASPPDDVA